MRNPLLRHITAGTMLALFLVPNVMPALHELLEHHEHFVCNAKDTLHWHDDVQECELCDYLIGIQTFHSDEQEEHFHHEVTYTSFLSHDVEMASRSFVTPHLRGPPV